MWDQKKIVFSGEIQKSENYYDLTYTELGAEKNFPRDADKKAKGLQAKTLIETYMDEKSIDTLQDIFDKHPDSVVEFTVLKTNDGTLGSNTIFWEVRNY